VIFTNFTKKNSLIKFIFRICVLFIFWFPEKMMLTQIERNRRAITDLQNDHLHSTETHTLSAHSSGAGLVNKPLIINADIPNSTDIRAMRAMQNYPSRSHYDNESSYRQELMRRQNTHAMRCVQFQTDLDNIASSLPSNVFEETEFLRILSGGECKTMPQFAEFMNIPRYLVAMRITHAIQNKKEVIKRKVPESTDTFYRGETYPPPEY
jgi:hypothetical protein